MSGRIYLVRWPSGWRATVDLKGTELEHRADLICGTGVASPHIAAEGPSPHAALSAVLEHLGRVWLEHQDLPTTEGA